MIPVYHASYQGSAGAYLKKRKPAGEGIRLCVPLPAGLCWSFSIFSCAAAPPLASAFSDSHRLLPASSAAWACDSSAHHTHAAQSTATHIPRIQSIPAILPFSISPFYTKARGLKLLNRAILYKALSFLSFIIILYFAFFNFQFISLSLFILSFRFLSFLESVFVSAKKEGQAFRLPLFRCL